MEIFWCCILLYTKETRYTGEWGNLVVLEEWISKDEMSAFTEETLLVNVDTQISMAVAFICFSSF